MWDSMMNAGLVKTGKQPQNTNKVRTGMPLRVNHSCNKNKQNSFQYNQTIQPNSHPNQSLNKKPIQLKSITRREQVPSQIKNGKNIKKHFLGECHANSVIINTQQFEWIGKAICYKSELQSLKQKVCEVDRQMKNTKCQINMIMKDQKIKAEKDVQQLKQQLHARDKNIRQKDEIIRKFIAITRNL